MGIGKTIHDWILSDTDTSKPLACGGGGGIYYGGTASVDYAGNRNICRAGGISEGIGAIYKASDYPYSSEEMEIAELKKAMRAIKELQEWALPVNMIVQCDYCGTFAVRGFSCTQCGAPIDLNKMSKTEE